MPKFVIKQDRAKCVGCGFCVALCPSNWYRADDNKAKPKKTIVKSLGCNKAAASNCPVQCIKILKG